LLHRHEAYDLAQAIAHRLAARIDQVPTLILRLNDQAAAFRELVGTERFQGWADGETRQARAAFFQALADAKPESSKVLRLGLAADELITLGALTGRARSDVLGELYAHVRQTLGPDQGEHIIRGIEDALRKPHRALPQELFDAVQPE
jgi:hypothetical protein